MQSINIRGVDNMRWGLFIGTIVFAAIVSVLIISIKNAAEKENLRQLEARRKARALRAKEQPSDDVAVIPSSNGRPLCPIKVDRIDIPYEIELMEYERSYTSSNGASVDVYFIPKGMRQFATEQVCQINRHLQIAHDLTGIPPFRVDPLRLFFTHTSPFVYDATCLEYSPLTKTGKLSKYPYSISFCDTPEHGSASRGGSHIHGCLFFKSGSLDLYKAHAYCWYNRNSYSVYVGEHQGEVQILRVETVNKQGEKVRIYDCSETNNHVII